MTEFENMNFEEMLDDGLGIIAEEINFSDIDNEENHQSQDLFPILPVRNMVMFPSVVTPITAGREKSKKLLEDAHKENKFIGIICQKNPNEENPTEKDLYIIGTLAKIIKIIKLPEGNITAITRGYYRFKIKKMVSNEPYFIAKIIAQKDFKPKDKEEFLALMDNIKDLAEKIINIDPNIPNAAQFALKNIEGEEELLNFVSANGNFSSDKKQKLLDEKTLIGRANAL